jgi:Fe-S cluster assembly iron-binding protein IscA
MAYSLVQDEPKQDDIITHVGDRTFLVQSEIADDVDFFEIDFHNGWLRKVFVIFPNGESY